MNSYTAAQLILIIALIALSAWFSSAETALTTVSEVSLKSLAADGNARAAKVLSILKNYSKMLSTILICNNVVNLSASALCTAFIIQCFGTSFVSAGTAALTILVILFGEITPKNISKIRAEQISMRDAPVISALMLLLTPLIAIISKLANGLMRLFGVDPSEKKHITEKELRTFVAAGREDGAIEGSEKKMIDNVFDFGDSEARDIMIPRIDMTCIPVSADYYEVQRMFRRDMFTRLPVYDEDQDHIIGHINIKDFILLDGPDGFSIRSLLRRPFYTYEFKKTADLLKEMQRRGVHVSFVLDEFGTTVGMITLEDLLEELIGEIRDEYDDDERRLIHRYDDVTYLVDGSMKLDDVNEALGTHFASEDYDSIGGLFLERLERLPRNEETIRLDDGTTLQVKGIRTNRIVKVLIRFPQPEDGSLPDGKEPDGGEQVQGPEVLSPADAFEQSAFADDVEPQPEAAEVR